MERTDMEKAVQELRELRRMADELAHEIEGLQDGIKAPDGRRGPGDGQRYRLESDIQGRHHFPHRHGGAEKGAARPGASIHEADDGAPILCGIKKAGLCPGTPMQTDTAPTAKRADTGEHGKSLYGYYTGFLRSFQVKTWSGGKSPPAPPRAADRR